MARGDRATLRASIAEPPSAEEMAIARRRPSLSASAPPTGPDATEPNPTSDTMSPARSTGRPRTLVR